MFRSLPVLCLGFALLSDYSGCSQWEGRCGNSSCQEVLVFPRSESVLSERCYQSRQAAVTSDRLDMTSIWSWLNSWLVARTQALAQNAKKHKRQRGKEAVSQGT